MTRGYLRLGLLVLVVSVVVSLPFMIFGEDVFMPLLETIRHRVFWLVLVAVVLLGLDAVLPVPSAWVIILLTREAGLAAGVLGGALGLILGVYVSGVVGRYAVGRLAPSFVPEAELLRLRDSIQRHTTLTLACMRSVPILAETSVMIAAASGVSQRQLLAATLLPNVVIAAVYAQSADDSLLMAALAFVGTILVSYLFWRMVDLTNQRRRSAVSD